MSAVTHRSIVVGFDGTPASIAALEFAFVEALDRGAPVVVVTTWMPEFPLALDSVGPETKDQATAACQMQDDAVRRVLAELGEKPPFTQVVKNDFSGPALVAAARTAALLVVGTGRKGRLSRTFLGSVSEFCVRHSPVPVVVVPAPVLPTHEVIRMPWAAAASFGGRLRPRWHDPQQHRTGSL